MKPKTTLLNTKRVTTISPWMAISSIARKSSRSGISSACSKSTTSNKYRENGGKLPKMLANK